jgi:5-methylcytosine-specific restriction endonuclease McrA
MKKISNLLRKEVYNKYNGRCAYCGKALSFDNFQIDHVIPIKTIKYSLKEENEVFNIDNLVPTFSIINHYKRSLDLNDFRKLLSTLHIRLKKLPKNPRIDKSKKRKEYLLKLAELFDIKEDKPFEGLFFFEKL